MFEYTVFSIQNFIKMHPMNNVENWICNYKGKQYFFELSLILYPDITLYKTNDKNIVETYNSASEAVHYARKFIAQEFNEYVYLVMCNTEGKGYCTGYYKVDSVFASLEDAHEYIMNQSRHMDIKQHTNFSYPKLLKADNNSEDLFLNFNEINYNGFKIVPMHIK